MTGWNTALLAQVPGVWQCFWLGYFLLGIAAEGSLCTGADQGVPTGARLCVGNLQAGVRPEAGEWKDLAMFSLRFGPVVLRYGKTHCSLVQGFMRGNESVP